MRSACGVCVYQNDLVCQKELRTTQGRGTTILHNVTNAVPEMSNSMHSYLVQACRRVSHPSQRMAATEHQVAVSAMHAVI